jgi:hypothetical protein
MKANLELLRADVRDELQKIARLEGAFDELAGTLARPSEEVL